MNLKKEAWLILMGLLCLSAWASAQSVYIPYNPDYYHLINRYEIKNKDFSKSFFTTVRPYTREGVAEFADSLLSKGQGLSKADRFNLEYMLIDNHEWVDSAKQALATSKKPFLKKLYEQKNAAFEVNTKDFHLQLNPVLHLAAGSDKNVDYTPLYNSRGIELRGWIGKKVGFYTYLTDNQLKFPGYVVQRIDERNSVPGEHFFKKNQDAYDFYSVRGYITFDLVKDLIALQFGHDKNFLGNGYRSLVLSADAPDYLFLKLNTKVWRLNYTNVFAKMTSSNVQLNNRYRVKYMAQHHLSLNITDNLNVGVFETIMMSREDTTNGNNYFDPDYLNPIIFYRAIEHKLGDPDNVMLGLDFKWNWLGKFRFYGQLVLDELLFKEITANNGWWGNKHAAQLGGAYIDAFGLKNLDLQGEVNLIRPFMYTHYGRHPFHSNHQHYEQPLAHPNGANLYEYIGVLRYQPIPRLSITVKGSFTTKGYDESLTGPNYGGNIHRSYADNRAREYGNEIGQGIKGITTYGEGVVSYQLRHNFFIDLKHIYRDFNSDNAAWSNTTNYTEFGIRWNHAPRNHEF